MTLFKRFQREALAASRLEHHNTVRVFDFGMGGDGTLFLAMELLRGRTLSRVMGEGPMPPGRAIRIAVQVCRSLAEAHQNGIIHRDMKPDNIMVFDTAGEKDFVKVLDFGIAKINGGTGESSVTRTGVIVGTPAYMAPEQASGSAVVPATDLYSLGVILFEALTGRQPFTGETPLAILLKHVHDPVPMLVMDGFPPDVPQALVDIVLALLQKRPEDRPAPALELAALLEAVPVASREGDGQAPPVAPGTQGTGAHATGARAAPSPGDSVAWPHPAVPLARLRRRGWALAGGALFLTCLGLGVVLGTGFVSPGLSPEPPSPAAVAVPSAPPAEPGASTANETPPPAPPPDLSAAPEPAAAEAAKAAPVPAPVEIGGAARTGPSTRATPVNPSAGGSVRAKTRWPRCIRSNCPIVGDCLDEAGQRLDGGSFCSDIAF